MGFRGPLVQIQSSRPDALMKRAGWLFAGLLFFFIRLRHNTLQFTAVMIGLHLSAMSQKNVEVNRAEAQRAKANTIGSVAYKRQPSVNYKKFAVSVDPCYICTVNLLCAWQGKCGYLRPFPFKKMLPSDS